jgi:hypothetical protein
MAFFDAADSRLCFFDSYEELCHLFFEQINTIIPIDKGAAFRAFRHRGRPLLSDPVIYGYEKESAVIAGVHLGRLSPLERTHYVSTSTVFLQSDIISPPEWEKTRISTPSGSRRTFTGASLWRS